MLKKLVLFDIDGTLLRVGKINRQSLIDALTAVYGTEGSARSHNFSGKMDSVIIYEVLKHAGLDEEHIEKRFDEVKRTYIELFRKQSRREDIELLKGVPPLLEELSRQNDVMLGLLTGNFEGSGRHKLRLPAIDHYFPFGAFADDAYDRNDLPAIAVDKAYALTGRRFLPDEVVIIGDTEHDIRCARTIRARCVAVATGNYSARQLEAHCPDVLFEDFGNTEEVVERIVNF